MEDHVLQPDLFTSPIRKHDWMEDRTEDSKSDPGELVDESSSENDLDLVEKVKEGMKSHPELVRKWRSSQYAVIAARRFEGQLVKKLEKDLRSGPQSSTFKPPSADQIRKAIASLVLKPTEETTTEDSSRSNETSRNGWKEYLIKEETLSFEGFADKAKCQEPFFDIHFKNECFEREDRAVRVDLTLDQMKIRDKNSCVDSARHKWKLPVVYSVTIKARPKFVDKACHRLDMKPRVTAPEFGVTDNASTSLQVNMMPWKSSLTCLCRQSISRQATGWKWLPAYEEDGKCVVWRWKVFRCANGTKLQNYHGTLDEKALGFKPNNVIINGEVGNASVTASWYFQPGFRQRPNVPPMSWEVEVTLSTVIQKSRILFYVTQPGTEFIIPNMDLTFA